MKSRIAVLFLALVVISQASWRSEASKDSIPVAPASGRLLGSSFVPVAVTIKKSGINSISEAGQVKDRAQNWILTFAGDHDFMPNSEIQVWLNADPGKSIEGQTFSLKPFAFGTKEGQFQRYGNRKGSCVPRGITSVFATLKQPGKTTKSEVFSDKLSAQLMFGKIVRGVLPGKVYLSMPDKGKSYLAGTFKARL